MTTSESISTTSTLIPGCIARKFLGPENPPPPMKSALSICGFTTLAMWNNFV
ncbi:MAG: hypothetical protein QXG67_00765 [Candidatus Nitrosotenuis sp.]